MKTQLSFFNFSVKKVIASEPDFFKRARIKIILTILVFTIVKTLIIVPIAVEYEQYRQMVRGIIIILLFLALIKLLLWRPATATVIAHIILSSGVLVIWSNLLVYVHHINILTIQLVFMVTLVSYYLIGGVKAACYTALSVSSVLFYMLTKHTSFGHFGLTRQELADTGMDSIIILNFITFVLIHYLYYQAFHHNLKEKILLNKQLQANILEAKALAESRSVFLSTMSHELRTPLNGVIGMTNLIKDSAIESQRDYVNALEFSATNLLAVVNDILDYNKIELDKIELEALPINLAILLKKICTGLEMRATEKGLMWQLRIDETLKNRLIITDPTRLTQIIYNLAGNAIKFTDRGTVGIKAHVIGQTEDVVDVKFTISDTGIGIAADRQEAVFELFTQASSDTTRKYGGTGLGLAIVKKLLKLFNSTIALTSKPEKGSVFTFTLPLSLYQGEAEITDQYNITKISLKGLKLLIAEDNHINVLLLQRLLSNWDVQTVVAANGREAVNKVANDNFDAVLMDIHMPVMDGYEATGAIRKLADPLKAQIPIIAITASVSHNIHAAIKEAGMQDFLSKPFQPDQLYDKLQQLYKPA